MNDIFIVLEESDITLPNYFVSNTLPNAIEIAQLRHGQRVLEAQFLYAASVLVLPPQILEFPSIFSADGVFLIDPANWEKEVNIEINTFLINDNFLKDSGCKTIFDFIDWISLENLIALFGKKMFHLAMVDEYKNISKSLVESNEI